MTKDIDDIQGSFCCQLT